MVMVIMTVFGMSFLMISETENQISIADRDGRQVLYVATAGTRLIESWFNIPDKAFNPMVPDRSQCILDRRVGDSDYDGLNDIDVPAAGAGHRYRGGTSTGTYRLFDKPFRGASRDTFWGSFSNPDILISNDLDADNEYLDRVSEMFNTDGSKSLDGIVITEIRVYAPPYDSDLEQRFGICTATVTAAKILRIGSLKRQVAERTVSIVLQEMPFPAPGAAIESAADVDVSGNFGVHWGGTFTEGGTSLQSGSNFPGPGLPRENTSRFRWADFSPNATDLDAGVAGTQNLLWQLLTDDAGDAVEIADPWLIFRANGSIEEALNSNDQPWPYDYTTGIEDDRSIFFQNQTYVFPELDYDFWKQYTQMRMRNANYFKFAGDGPVFQKNGVGIAEDMEYWTNTTRAHVDPGIFFFDTMNAVDPQDGSGGVLVPDIKLNSSVVDVNDFLMQGVIYTNAEVIDSSGISGSAVSTLVNAPAEPFLDTGIDIDKDGTVGNVWTEVETIGNNVWDFAYASSVESDGMYYDEQYGTAEYLAFEASHRVSDGVLPDLGLDPRIFADVVHEPFLNFAYPEPLDEEGPMYVDFDFEVTTLRDMGGDRDENGAVDTMTSLRDNRGAQLELDIVLNGVWYNEGAYVGSGNLPVYGSILMKTGFTATGSPNVFYNEGLLLGDWPPAEMLIPRVYVSHVDVE
jgi:hypothetical protein